MILTEGEWLKTLKRYPFEVQSLPGASFTLIQQVGRLIRSHECKGEIVIYDRRLLSKSYGARLLGALPVFPIEQRPMPEGELPKFLRLRAIKNQQVARVASVVLAVEAEIRAKYNCQSK